MVLSVALRRSGRVSGAFSAASKQLWAGHFFSTSSPEEDENQHSDETIDFGAYSCIGRARFWVFWVFKERSVQCAGFQQVGKDQKQNLVGRVFSNVAPSYDIMNDLMSGGLHRLWKDRLVEKLAPFPGMAHIDVAGGTGDVAFRVMKGIESAERMKCSVNNEMDTKGSVTVFDINKEMLQEGRKKASTQGIGELLAPLNATFSAILAVSLKMK